MRAIGTSKHADVRIDLHLHSTASDGRLTPAEVAERVAWRGLAAWALCDHDTVAGVLELHGRPGLIPGVEISASDGQGEIHILGLGIRPEETALTAFLAGQVQRRRERAERFLGLIAQRSGVHLELAVCQPPQAAVITRSHLAAALVTAGIAHHTTEAYRDWLATSPGPSESFPPVQEAIAVIHAAGGVAILAHPGALQDLPRIERLLGQGFDGVEVRHPHLHPSIQGLVMDLAAKKGLLMSAGSDDHRDGDRIGDYKLPKPQIMPLLERVGWKPPER